MLPTKVMATGRVTTRRDWDGKQIVNPVNTSNITEAHNVTITNNTPQIVIGDRYICEPQPLCLSVNNGRTPIERTPNYAFSVSCARLSGALGSASSVSGVRLPKRPPVSPVSGVLLSMRPPDSVSSVSGIRLSAAARLRPLRLRRPLVEAIATLLRFWRPLVKALARLRLFRLRHPLVGGSSTTSPPSSASACRSDRPLPPSLASACRITRQSPPFPASALKALTRLRLLRLRRPLVNALARLRLLRLRHPLVGGSSTPSPPSSASACRSDRPLPPSLASAFESPASLLRFRRPPVKALTRLRFLRLRRPLVNALARLRLLHLRHPRVGGSSTPSPPSSASACRSDRPLPPSLASACRSARQSPPFPAYAWRARSTPSPPSLAPACRSARPNCPVRYEQCQRLIPFTAITPHQPTSHILVDLQLR